MSGTNEDTQFEERLSDDQLAEQRRLLAEQQAEAQQKLDRLVAAARGAERKLAEHEARHGEYELLEQACAAVQKLSDEGLAELFWGERAAAADGNLEAARARIDIYRLERDRLESEHEAALDKVDRQQAELDFVDYDLYQALQLEESRKREWLIERDATELPPRRIVMPWMRGFEDDTRFRKTLAASALTGLLLGLVIPFVELPVLEREELTEVPERFAQLIRKEQERPAPPPKPKQEKPPEPDEEPEPEKPEEQPPEPEVATEAKPKSTRDKVNSVGILAFRENFSSLKESRPAARLGSLAKVTDAGQTAVGRPERAMVTALGAGDSGGINLAGISRDVNGGDVELVAGVQLSQVESAIDGGGPDNRPRAAGAVAGRTDEEIQIVFDRYKAALYRLYNRELRRDPTLRGQMVLKLTIEPDGSVSLCRLQSSDMDAPALAERVVGSVKTFQFGAKDVPAITILYPIDFLPTA